jgi:hypothetical protein
MPEAPVHEDGDVLSVKGEVRCSRQVFGVDPPSSDPGPREQRTETAFR